MARRLEPLEAKFLDCGPSRLDCTAIVFKLAMLNSNMRALTDVLVSNLKHFQKSMNPDLKVDVGKTIAMNASLENTLHPAPLHNEHEGVECIC